MGRLTKVPTENSPPRPPSSSRSVVGIARQVRRQSVPYRGNPGAWQLLTFRVDVVDARGNLLPPHAVELRGNEVLGNVEEGDWVEIDERPDRHGRVKSFVNLTTGARVRRKRNIIA